MIILVQILQLEWSLTARQTEILGSLFYVGLFFGAIVAGISCNYFGRKKSMIIGSLI